MKCNFLWLGFFVATLPVGGSTAAAKETLTIDKNSVFTKAKNFLWHNRTYAEWGLFVVASAYIYQVHFSRYRLVKRSDFKDLVKYLEYYMKDKESTEAYLKEYFAPILYIYQVESRKIEWDKDTPLPPEKPKLNDITDMLKRITMIKTNIMRESVHFEGGLENEMNGNGQNKERRKSI